MCVTLRKFKVLDIRSGYSHKLSRNSSLVASHEILSTRNRKSLQIFRLAKVSLVKVFTIKI